MRRAGLASLLLLVTSMLGCGSEGGPHKVVALDDDTVQTYLAAYRVIGPAYKAAYESGASPLAIHERPDIRSALQSAGWSWEYYQSVHGSVSSAMLRYELPEEYKKIKMSEDAAPQQNVDLVEKYYFELKEARLQVARETYREKNGSP